MDRAEVHAQRRQELIRELLHASVVLGSSGFLPATDGNFSARFDAMRILVTARGTDKRRLGEADIGEISLDEIRPVTASTEWPMHRAIYLKRPDVNAVLHVHSPALTAFAAAHRIPRCEILAEAYVTIGRIVLVPFATPGTETVGESLLRSAMNASVYLLANHGAVAVGVSVREALYRIERAEFLANVELHAASLGGAVSLTPEQLSSTV